MVTSSRGRTAYHHGNLKPAVLDAALRQVATGGMSSLVARELAREVGVAPAAVYRHFPDVEHLRAAVSQGARQELGRRMLLALDGVLPRRTLAEEAIARFAAIGDAYIRFALAEPGLFDAAFAACVVAPAQPDEPNARAILERALDDLVTVGAMTPAQRPHAPLIAWTSVHGLASLLAFGGGSLGGPADEAIDIVIRGVLAALHVTEEPR